MFVRTSITPSWTHRYTTGQGSYDPLVVEFRNYIMMLEAGQSQARAQAYVDEINPSTSALLSTVKSATLAITINQPKSQFLAPTAAQRAINGGIAASADAFALSLLGVDDVALYDGSLVEWASDPSLPLEVG